MWSFSWPDCYIGRARTDIKWANSMRNVMVGRTLSHLFVPNLTILLEDSHLCHGVLALEIGLKIPKANLSYLIWNWSKNIPSKTNKRQYGAAEPMAHHSVSLTSKYPTKRCIIRIAVLISRTLSPVKTIQIVQELHKFSAGREVDLFG